MCICFFKKVFVYSYIYNIYGKVAFKMNGCQQYIVCRYENLCSFPFLYLCTEKQLHFFWMCDIILKESKILLSKGVGSKPAPLYLLRRDWIIWQKIRAEIP